MSMAVTLNREDIVRLCERIEGAQTRAYAIPKLTDEYPGMTIGDGYAVQLELRRRFLTCRSQAGGLESRPDLEGQDDSDGRQCAVHRLSDRPHGAS
jgi:hypothetical protein